MTQLERREYMIKTLLAEEPRYARITVPISEDEQCQLMRALMNVRPSKAVSEEFLTVQNEYLQEELSHRALTALEDIEPAEPGIFLWQGDITTLKCDAIVNAANSGLTGCYYPCHNCIDNVIHTHAGIQLRLDCDEIIKKQGFPEPTGMAKITKAHNLPSRYVLHTVGPIISGPLTKRDEELLVSCYRSCLELAEQHELESVAFCCISTGEFHFPNRRAAELAVAFVREYKAAGGRINVIFNVFKDIDAQIYRELLS